MKIIVTASFICLLAFSAYAQVLTQPMDVRKLTDDVMKEISKTNYNGGLDMLKQYSFLSSAEIDTIETTLKAQLPKIEPSYGKILGSELVSQKQIGDSLLSLNYLLRMEKYALRWTFSFYNGSKGWNLVYIDYNDKLQVLFSGEASN